MPARSSSICRNVTPSVYIDILYTPNLGFEIAVPGREREQGRFRGSSEGAGESTRGAGGACREHRGSINASYPARVAHE